MMNKDIDDVKNIRHTRLYDIWKNMRARCNRKTCPAFERYGGRGISISPEWDNFEVFCEWAMQSGYDDSLSIDRVDVNGDYCPGNCRWANDYEQANNTRKNRLIEYHGEVHSVMEWSRILDIPMSTLRNRLVTLGWTVEEAFEKHPKKRSGKRNPKSIPVMCVETGRQFDCMNDAAKWAGVYAANICNACRNPELVAGGYHWEIS